MDGTARGGFGAAACCACIPSSHICMAPQRQGFFTETTTHFKLDYRLLHVYK
jgi:hypothetical protein